MAGRNHVGTIFEGGFEEKFEFNFLVTHDVRVWRTALFVFIDHVVDDFMAVLVFEIKDLEINAELYGNALCIRQILSPWALHARQVLAPVFHIHTSYFVALLDKQSRGNAAVNATAHSYVYARHCRSTPPVASISELIVSGIASAQPVGVDHHIGPH